MCKDNINYGEIVPFAISAFRTKEKKDINVLINEWRVVMKFEKV